MSDWLAPVLGNLTYLLIALSFLVRDILWLRIVAVIASGFSIGYNLLARGDPLWLVIEWNIVFIAINVARIGMLVRERMACDFDELETELHETVFRGLGDVELMKLLRVARWSEVAAGFVLATQGADLDDLVLVYNGTAEVAVDGRHVATIRDGAFIGEMSFTTSGPASATVTVSTPSRIVRWPKSELRVLLDRNPGLALSLQGVLSRDMARKLSSSRTRRRLVDPDAPAE